MSKETWLVLNALAWCVAFGFMFYGGIKGFSGVPKFSMWMGGVSLVLQLVMLGVWLESALKP